MIPPSPSAEDAERQLAQLAELAGYDGEAVVVLTRLAEVVMPRGAPRGVPSPSAGLEDRVRRSEMRLRALVDQIPAVVFVAALGEDENEVYVSPQIESLLGFTQAEWLGNPLLWYSQLHPDDHDVVIEAFTKGVQTGGPFRAEVRFFARDGRQVWIHGEAQLIRDEHGQPEYFQGVGFDITPSKEAQEVVTRAERAKAEAAQTFLATMSHELRTPMNSVIVLACLLADTELSPDQRDMLRSLELSADHLLSLINDILDFSRLRAGRVDLMPRAFELAPWLEDTLEMVAPRAAEKFLGLRYTLESGLPTRVTADDGRLRQVLLNLAGNAIKFTHAGEVEVKVRSLPAGGGLTRFECAVSDTGIGIAPDRLHVLFEEFSQADGGITREFGGTGLGLAISRSLVELMGGEISVASERGVGSVFTFSWVCPAETPPARDDGQPGVALAGRRLLVVDDRPADAELVAGLARSWGMEVAVTRRAEEAMAWLRAGRHFDVAVVGHNTSGSAGLASARAIGEAQTGRPLPVLVSAYAIHGAGLRGDGHTVAGLLIKPLRQSSLARSLAEVLESGKLRGAAPAAVSSLAEALPLRILVAEDNDMNQEAVRRLLGSLGYGLDMVANGQEAVDAVARSAYDVVLMDMAMPGMDGLTATRLIRSQGDAVHQPRVVALTANALPGDREACLAAGMDAYLTKPINRQELAGVLGGVAPAAAPAGPVASGGAYDETVLSKLRLQFGDEATTHLVGLFRKGVGGMLAELAQATAAADAATVYRLMHTLKSSAQMVGAIGLAGMCERIETSSREGDLTTPAADIAAMPAMVSETLAWLAATGSAD